jgi:hypothetical protein
MSTGSGVVLDKSGGFFSSDGDPFCVLAAFDEWVRLKSSGGNRRFSAPTRHWCRHHAIIEQRLYEMARLVRQFKDTLTDAGLDRRDGDDDDDEEDDGNDADPAERRRSRRGDRELLVDDDADEEGVDRATLKRRLRFLKQDAASDKRRRMLSLQDSLHGAVDAVDDAAGGGGGGDDGGGDDGRDGGHDGRGRGDRGRGRGRGRGGHGHGHRDDTMNDVHAIDFCKDP